MWLIDPLGVIDSGAVFHACITAGLWLAHLLLVYMALSYPRGGLAPEFWEGGNVVSPFNAGVFGPVRESRSLFLPEFYWPGRISSTETSASKWASPMSRILIMQFSLFLGGFLVGVFDSALLVLLLLILLKVVTDLRAHFLEHRTGLNSG